MTLLKYPSFSFIYLFFFFWAITCFIGIICVFFWCLEEIKKKACREVGQQANFRKIYSPSTLFEATALGGPPASKVL